MAVEHQPPHNLEAERALLGSLLLDREAILRVADLLRPEDFYYQAHAQIYRAIYDLYQARRPPDLITVTDELRRRGELEAVGGAEYLAELMELVPTSAHVEHYARIVEELAVRRRLIQTAGQIATLGYRQEEEDVNLLLDQAEQLLFSVAEERSRQGAVHIREVVGEFFDRIAYLQEHRGEIVGVPTGFRDLDELLGGLQPSDMIVLAARPSAGKTSLALNIAYNVAVLQGLPTLIFSLEMSREQLLHRLLAMKAGVSAHRLRLGKLTEEEWGEVSRAMGELGEAPLYIDDAPNQTVSELRTKARRVHAEVGLQLIIIDYLQLMRTGRRNENRVQEVSELSRSVKALARELKVPVLILSQLSRAVEQREDHRPRLSDLRESGSIEQDADVVMFIYREEMYDKETDKRGIAEILVEKHRSGPTGRISLRFFEETTRFANLARQKVPTETLEEGYGADRSL